PGIIPAHGAKRALERQTGLESGLLSSIRRLRRPKQRRPVDPRLAVIIPRIGRAHLAKLRAHQVGAVLGAGQPAPSTCRAPTCAAARFSPIRLALEPASSARSPGMRPSGSRWARKPPSAMARLGLPAPLARAALRVNGAGRGWARWRAK